MVENKKIDFLKADNQFKSQVISGNEIAVANFLLTMTQDRNAKYCSWKIKDGNKKELENESMRFLIAGKGFRTNKSRIQMIKVIKAIRAMLIKKLVKGKQIYVSLVNILPGIDICNSEGIIFWKKKNYTHYLINLPGENELQKIFEEEKEKRQWFFDTSSSISWHNRCVVFHYSTNRWKDRYLSPL